MNLDQLEALEAIIECGSFRGAAVKLNNSQPNLSRLVRNLEDDLGVILFDRKTYRPSLTKEGELFFKAARITLQSARNLKVYGEELSFNKTESKIHISIDPLTPVSLIDKIINTNLNHQVKPTLILKTAVLSEAGNDVSSGVSILAIGPNQAKIKGIFCEHLFNVEIVTVVSRKMFKKFKMNEELVISHLPQVLVKQNNFSEKVDTLSSSRSSSSSQEIFVTDHSLKVDLISRGVAWGKIAKHEIDNFPKDHFVLLNKTLLSKLTIPFYLIRNETKPLGPVGREIFEICLDFKS